MNKREAQEDDVCSFFLERKKRPCRMKKAEGKAYCPHHSHLGSEIVNLLYYNNYILQTIKQINFIHTMYFLLYMYVLFV